MTVTYYYHDTPQLVQEFKNLGEVAFLVLPRVDETVIIGHWSYTVWRIVHRPEQDAFTQQVAIYLTDRQ